MDRAQILIRFSDSAVGVTGWGAIWLFTFVLAIMSNGNKS